MSSDPPQTGGLRAAAGPSIWTWRPAAGGYLLLVLAGLAAGLWPGAIFPPMGLGGGPVPALQSLAVAQVAFFLLAYPLVLARRARPRLQTAQPWHPAGAAGAERFWLSCALESAMLLLATAPLYAVAAWVSDAVWTDCLRSAAAAACFCPLGWAAGRCLCREIWPSAVLICLLAATVGLAWAQYVCRDFAGAERAADALWHAAPATFVWDAAASRQGGWRPGPAWVILLWLAAAAGLAALAAGRKPAPPLRPPGRPRDANHPQRPPGDKELP